MGNASQINRSRNSVRVERTSDLNESDLGEVYCIIMSSELVTTSDATLDDKKLTQLVFTIVEDNDHRVRWQREKITISAMRFFPHHTQTARIVWL